MNESYLVVLMFLGVLFGYFVSRIAHEELSELKVALEYGLVLCASIALAIASHFNIWLSAAVFAVTSVVLFFYHDQHVQKALLVAFGILMFLVKETFMFALAVLIFMMFVVSVNYHKRFEKNAVVYLYFLVPAVIVLIAVRFL